ncbi:hypothetical protein BpHYR1_014548 [Brachionus plicatilis]|uniref:RNA-directed DNA polymerase from mobile element jockey-like n=1 Tax=Brachionus plicatilis TaxID=10195 RepID=A0A3M7PUD1_BRAPC|nr:hypothetical protein BpHYR1_014548 [Brachionus plicatilis]
MAALLLIFRFFLFKIKIYQADFRLKLDINLLPLKPKIQEAKSTVNSECTTAFRIKSSNYVNLNFCLRFFSVNCNAINLQIEFNKSLKVYIFLLLIINQIPKIYQDFKLSKITIALKKTFQNKSILQLFVRYLNKHLLKLYMKFCDDTMKKYLTSDHTRTKRYNFMKTILSWWKDKLKIFLAKNVKEIINYVLDWNTGHGVIDKQINFTLHLNKQNSFGLKRRSTKKNVLRRRLCWINKVKLYTLNTLLNEREKFKFG